MNSLAIVESRGFDAAQSALLKRANYVCAKPLRLDIAGALFSAARRSASKAGTSPVPPLTNQYSRLHPNNGMQNCMGLCSAYAASASAPQPRSHCAEDEIDPIRDIPSQKTNPEKDQAGSYPWIKVALAALGLGWALNWYNAASPALPQIPSKELPDSSNNNPEFRPLSETDEFSKNVQLGGPPIGVVNEADDCFISSYLQAFVMEDPVWEPLFSQETNQSSTREIGGFIRSYRRAQKTRQPCCKGVHGIRNALSRLSGNNLFLSGQHDPTEAFGLLLANDYIQTLLGKTGARAPHSVKTYWQLPASQPPEILIKAAEENHDFFIQKDHLGYFTLWEDFDFYGNIAIGYEPNKSLATLFYNSFFNNFPEKRKVVIGNNSYKLIRENVYPAWESPPLRFILTVKAFQGLNMEHAQKTESLESVEMEFAPPAHWFPSAEPCKYQLTSFVAHLGKTGHRGHYIAYVRRGNEYYLCNDSQVTQIDERAFLNAATSAYIFKYALVK